MQSKQSVVDRTCYETHTKDNITTIGVFAASKQCFDLGTKSHKRCKLLDPSALTDTRRGTGAVGSPLEELAIQEANQSITRGLGSRPLQRRQCDFLAHHESLVQERRLASMSIRIVHYWKCQRVHLRTLESSRPLGCLALRQVSKHKCELISAMTQCVDILPVSGRES